MITDAILNLGTTILTTLTSWLPTTTLQPQDFTHWAQTAGGFVSLFLDLPTLKFAVSLVLTTELSLLTVRLGMWAWRLIHG